MKDKIDFSELPHNYPACINQQCPKADHCLRQLAEQSLPDTVEFWSYARPKQVASPDYDCPFYRSNKKVRYAKGVLKTFSDLSNKQIQAIRRHLTDHFCERTYYRIRKGERVLSPSEQEFLKDVFRQCGITAPLEFDAYFEDFEW